MDLGVTKVLDETEQPETEGEDERQGEDEGEEDEDAPDENEVQRLFEAVREGDQGVIDELLLGDEEHPPMTGFLVDSAFEAGMTSLHWLTVEGHASVRTATPNTTTPNATAANRTPPPLPLPHRWRSG